jgi:hypothetical protein
MKLPLDQFILLVQGYPPYIGKKNVYYEDPIFKARLLPPAFTNREEALKAAKHTIAKLEKRKWFERGDTVRSIEMSDEDVASMWADCAGLYDEPDLPKSSASIPSDKNNFSDDDNSKYNFLKS